MILTWQNFEVFNHGLKPPEKNLFNFQFRQGDRYTLVTALNNLDHLDPDLAHHLQDIKMCSSHSYR